MTLYADTHPGAQASISTHTHVFVCPRQHAQTQAAREPIVQGAHECSGARAPIQPHADPVALTHHAQTSDSGLEPTKRWDMSSGFPCTLWPWHLTLGVLGKQMRVSGSFVQPQLTPCPGCSPQPNRPLHPHRDPVTAEPGLPMWLQQSWGHGSVHPPAHAAVGAHTGSAPTFTHGAGPGAGGSHP